MTWPTWTCIFSDGAYDLMLKKNQWAVVFTWQTAWQNTRWQSPVEVTQFPQHPTPSTSELHSIGPWPTRNIYISSRWKSMHGATYFDDRLVQNGEHTLMYFKHQQQHLPLPQPSIAHQCGVEVPTHIDSMQLWTTAFDWCPDAYDRHQPSCCQLSAG